MAASFAIAASGEFVLCQVMQMDFTDGTGRYDDRGAELYSDADLRYGILWAESYQHEGLTCEPMKGYSLSAFARWCRRNLKKQKRPAVNEDA